ncbi:hypothetical protein DV736_g3009, partial [Chaetothyriales sp. CBS 134916]
MKANMKKVNMNKANMKKAKPSAYSQLASPPWLYINDPQVDLPNANAIAAIIPVTTLVHADNGNVDQVISQLEAANFCDSISIIAHNKDDDQNDSKIKAALQIQAATIRHGCNFVSINMYLESPSASTDLDKWGANHLDLNIARLAPHEVADKVYRWLLNILSIQETLHLITESEMRAFDPKAFPGFNYCAIADFKHHPLDAKLVFVVLIMSKPKVSHSKVITWTVADRTGVANFYFKHRGPGSDYTWNWVLNLKPGERRALRRMHCVKVVESLPKRILKLPFRATGEVIQGTGATVKTIGIGIVKAGQALKMGQSTEWILQADAKLVNGKYVKVTDSVGGGDNGIAIKTRKASREIKVFDEKRSRLWKDEDWDARTEKGSILDGKLDV